MPLFCLIKSYISDREMRKDIRIDYIIILRYFCVSPKNKMK